MLSTMGIGGPSSCDRTATVRHLILVNVYEFSYGAGYRLTAWQMRARYVEVRPSQVVRGSFDFVFPAGVLESEVRETRHSRSNPVLCYSLGPDRISVRMVALQR